MEDFESCLAKPGKSFSAGESDWAPKQVLQEVPSPTVFKEHLDYILRDMVWLLGYSPAENIIWI